MIHDFLGTMVRPPRVGFASTVNGIRYQLVAHAQELYAADQRCPFAREIRRTNAAEAAERVRCEYVVAVRPEVRVARGYVFVRAGFTRLIVCVK